MNALVYDPSAPRKPTNLTVNSDLIRKAKERKINVSSVLEQALAEEIRQRERSDWKEQNRESIEHFNKLIQKKGVFSDGLRSF